MLKPRGYLHLIYPASDLASVISVLFEKTGQIQLYPLWPKENKEAKRFIIVARKGVQTPSKLFRGLILHNLDGTYTAAAESVLMKGKGLFD